MTELQKRRHGLESFQASRPANEDDAASVTIWTQPDLGHINLRGDIGNSEFIATAQSELGQELPVAPNTVSTGDHRVYWLGPNEWLIVTAITDALDLMTQLRESFAGQHASVTDVSGGQVAIQLAGPGARDVLTKGCTLDFHRDKFTTGNCAQSGLAKANVLIGVVDDKPSYEIIVRRSYAEYLVLWLTNAVREYGVKFSFT